MLCFQVTAHSTTGATATTSVKISVLDANDNAPSFEKGRYEVSVHESTPTSTPLISVRATDADDGDNGRVAYSIAGDGGKGAFSIDASTGIVSLQVRRLGRGKNLFCCCKYPGKVREKYS